MKLKTLISTLCIILSFLFAFSPPVHASDHNTIQTVHANYYYAGTMPIYYDGEKIIFDDEQNFRVWPIAYNGSVYLPIRTASEWLGKEVVWNQDSHTINFFGTVEPVIKTSGYVTRSSSEEDISVKQSWLENGIDVQLRPDITILIDGESYLFYNVNMEPVVPLVWNESVYLPLRGISVLLGKGITYIADDSVSKIPMILIYNYLSDEEYTNLITYYDHLLSKGKDLRTYGEAFISL